MAAAIPHVAPRHWVYLDDQRTHEVHAQVALRAGEGVLVTTEFPAGSRDPAEVVQAQTRIAGEHELVDLLRELEDRLALAGRYFRADAQELKWAPLAPPTRTVDMRAHEAPLPDGSGRMRVHHFHGEKKDRLLIAMPRPGMSARHVLAEMTFEFPHIEAGEMNVLHTRLSPATLASAVAREHIEAPRRGLAKLFEAADYARAYGERWIEPTRVMLAGAAARIVGGDTPAPAPLVQHAPPTRLEQIKDGLSAPQVARLRGRWLDAVTEARLVDGGEHAIRKYVNGLRKKEQHDKSYELSILEATLLLQYAIPASMWDLAHEEGEKLMRFLHGYG